MRQTDHLTRSQCRRCAIGAYHDGKCYADIKKGRPVEQYGSCYAAGQPRKRHNNGKD